MVSCHIATLPERVESLKQVIASISPQVDKVYIMLNGHTEVPSFLRELRNVNYEICDNSLTDGAKWLHVNDEPAVCVILDDDLIATPLFVKYMLEGLHRYGAAVSLHGKRYDTKPVLRFRRSYTSNFRCLGNVDSDIPVHLIGTGCMLFDNRRIMLDQSVYEYKDMADVLFSRFCTYNNIPMTVLKHRAGQFLRYIPQAETIWHRTYDDKIQTEILNNYLK
jgi:hypothetical protein